MSATVLPTTFEDELQDFVLGLEAKRFPGSNKIIMITIAVFVFSELKKAFGIFKDAHEVKSANLIGVMIIAYTNTSLSYL